MDYVVAAKASGATAGHIPLKKLLPNVIYLVVIRAVSMFGGLVLAEAVLSYVGVGAGPDSLWQK